MNRVGRHDAAFERYAFEQFDCGLGLAAFAGFGLSEGHAQGHAPHRHHHGRHVSTALLVGTLEALAVDCQDGSASTRTERLAKRLHKAGKRILQRDRIEHAQHPAERIMAGNAVLEFKDSPKKISLLDTELCYLDARFRPAKHSSKSDEQHFAQVMACIDIARIRYRLKYNEEIAHPSAPKNYQDIRKNPYFNESQGPVYSDAIPLGQTRVGWERERTVRDAWSTGSQIIRATNGIFRSSTVSAQLPQSVPTNTIAALTP